MHEMEAYKQKKDEEAASVKKEEEEHMKLQKQEALQLLKKKEKTENLIKVFLFYTLVLALSYCFPPYTVIVDLWLIHLNICRKQK